MSMLQVMPVLWERFQDIDSVEPVNDRDAACLMEVREVLKKHGMRDRFGVALLHKHFDLEEDEVMVESTDKAERVQVIKPMKKSAVPNAIGTIWKLADGEFNAMLTCYGSCDKDVQGNHIHTHRYP